MSDSSHIGALSHFSSDLVDRCRQRGGVLALPGGRIVLPTVFGFCRGVKRALAMLDQEVARHAQAGGRLFLLGEIIHNPWVNDYFQHRSVTILRTEDRGRLESLISADDCAIIPAFGVPLPVEERLRQIGCRIVDTSCGDVRRLWKWAEGAAQSGYGVMIFGRAVHDETVVTRSRLEACGGRYLVVNKLSQVDWFCDIVTGRKPTAAFGELLAKAASNTAEFSPFERLAHVSQTTMLYDETMLVQTKLREAFASRFGVDRAEGRLRLQPTVCRATQARQSAAVTLCQEKPDVVVVVGGFGSSNTRHLHELARSYAAAYFIEDADAILDAHTLRTFDAATSQPILARDWLPEKRPVTVGVLSGASSPEIVIGEVLQKIAGFLG
ncbi:MAG: hypothetical protein FWE88_06410 [Phycisphaerae bacterium]|nr:hypothetical protein [Phycisphaerae bacterium]